MSKHETKPEPSITSASQHDETIELSDAAANLLRSLEVERDDAIAARQRALADFANYQRRATENERRAHHAGASSVVRSIIPVLDHFDLALGQRADQLTVEQLIGGVKMVRDELAKALHMSGVERIEPKANDPFDPNRHEAMMRQAAPGVEPDHIVSVLQAGYAMGDIVLRPAKVAIAAEATGSET